MSATQINERSSSEREYITRAAPLARRLIIEITCDELRVMVYPVSKPNQPIGYPLAYATAPLDRCRIYGGESPSLWLHHTSFAITEAEARDIAANFGVELRS
jgi:hypothetical protein